MFKEFAKHIIVLVCAFGVVAIIGFYSKYFDLNSDKSLLDFVLNDLFQLIVNIILICFAMIEGVTTKDEKQKCYLLLL